MPVLPDLTLAKPSPARRGPDRRPAAPRDRPLRARADGEPALLDLFAVLPRGVDDLARVELAACGASDLRGTAAGIGFRGDLAVAYRACLWSRLASRILMNLATVPAGSSKELYEALYELPWERHLDPDGTLAIDAHARGEARDLNTHFVALKVKDAIVDRLRDRTGRRPGVDLEHPSLRVHVVVQGGTALVSIDLSGDPLHRRGWRGATGAAPLKENVAAALLLRAGWPAIAARGGALVDPMCGSGTLLVEGGWIAGDVAPGLLRERFGFTGWRGHDSGLWRGLRSDALARRDAGRLRVPPLAGSDHDPRAVDLARIHVAAAGLDAAELTVRDVGDAAPPAGVTGGLVATNPPYGERLGNEAGLLALFGRFGEALKANFPGWNVALLATDPAIAGEVRMRPGKRNVLWNGPLKCELLQYEVRRPASD
jgi:23S rRNA (guanine2445-N2)-methyltransferase / 23S rRNA (guanine2069-N7)-methyltransferase